MGATSWYSLRQAKATPLFGLGQHPVRTGVADGAEHHDARLYGGT